MVAGALVDKIRSFIKPASERGALTTRGLEKLRAQLRECAEGLGGEVSARGRAVRLAETYLGLDDEGRHRFLKLIALEFGPDAAPRPARPEGFDLLAADFLDLARQLGA